MNPFIFLHIESTCRLEINIASMVGKQGTENIVVKGGNISNGYQYFLFVSQYIKHSVYVKMFC